MEWKPTPREAEFIALPDTIKEGMYGGAAGGGKSETLLMIPIVRGFYKHPQFKGLILRRTFPELEQSLILRSEEWYGKRATGGNYNDQKHRWRWPSGAILQFGYAEHEKDVRRYDTSEWNYIAFDELTSFTEFQYIYLAMTRCRSSTSDLPAIIRSGTNPGNIGHGWVRKRFVEPAKNGHVIVRDAKTGLKRIFIPARVTDNKYTLAANPQYIQQLETLPEAEKRAKLFGDWWTFSGQVFDEWRSERMPDEPENAIHVIDPFPIPDWWPVIVAVDWGYSAMTWAGFAALSPDRRVFLFDEYAARRQKISVWAAEIKRRCALIKNLKEVVLDPSAWSQRGDEFTIVEQFMNISGIVPTKADQDRIGGKLLLHEYLRWEPKTALQALSGETYDQEVAQKLLRRANMKTYNAYLDSFKEEPKETNLPRFQVFRPCKEVQHTIPLCIYPENSRKTNKPPEDVAEFDGDDPYDGTRYLLKAVDKYFNSVESESKELGRRAKIVDYLERTGDQTGFYRQMEHFEGTIQRNNRPRRLYTSLRSGMPLVPSAVRLAAKRDFSE